MLANLRDCKLFGQAFRACLSQRLCVTHSLSRVVTYMNFPELDSVLNMYKLI